MELRELLNPYIEGIEKGISSENWIVTIMAALTLPDICSSLEGKKKGEDYIDWFNEYVSEYRMTFHSSKALKMANTYEESLAAVEKLSSFDDIEEETHEYLNGVNVYALRCAILHNGDGEVGTQKISVKKSEFTLGIKKVKFYSEITNRVIFQYGDTVFINPKVFCEAILDGVEKWIIQNKDNQFVLEGIQKLQIFE